jgi:hypothetical protein
MLRRSSESDDVLMCLCAVASRKWRRDAVLIRLPFCSLGSDFSGLKVSANERAD